MPKQLVKRSSPREIKLGLWRSYRVMLTKGLCFRPVSMALNYTHWIHCRLRSRDMHYNRRGDHYHPLTIPLVSETIHQISGMLLLLNIKSIARSPRQLTERMGPGFGVRWQALLKRVR